MNNEINDEEEELIFYICSEPGKEIFVNEKTISILRNQHIRTTLKELKRNFYEECLLLAYIESLQHGFRSHETQLPTTTKSSSMEMYLVEKETFNEKEEHLIFFRVGLHSFLPTMKIIVFSWNIPISNDRGWTDYPEDWISKQNSEGSCVNWKNHNLMKIFIKYIFYLLKNRYTTNKDKQEHDLFKILKEIDVILKDEKTPKQKAIKKFFVFYCQTLGLR